MQMGLTSNLQLEGCGRAKKNIQIAKLRAKRDPLQSAKTYLPKCLQIASGNSHNIGGGKAHCQDVDATAKQCNQNS